MSYDFRDQADAYRDKTRNFGQRHPFTLAIIAAVIGFVVGLIVG